MTDAGPVVVLSTSGGEPLDVLDGPGQARAIVGPHMGAALRSMWVLELKPGSSTVQLRHHGEAVYYLAEGSGTTIVDDERLDLDPGAMIHVEPGARYRLHAAGDGAKLFGGPSPPDPPGAPAPASRGARVCRFHRDRPARRVPMISKDARLVVFPGVGAQTANMNYVVLEPGEANQPHSHQVSEDTIVILSGRGSVDDLTHRVTLRFEAGDVIHVPVAIEHRVKADLGSGIVSVGGPCPADPAMLGPTSPED